MAGKFGLKRPALPFWHPATLVATWFGTGLLPLAPGSWGSLAALPFAWLILVFGGADGWRYLLIAAVALFLLGWAASKVYLRRSGGKDPQEIVVDEVAAQWLALLVARPDTGWHWLAGFLLFRLCDVLKPFPAGMIDRRGGALAVMADDIVAGAYALFLLAIAISIRSVTHGP